MEKTNYILKGLGYSYILTLATLLIYNLALTFTSLSGNSIAMASSAITTVSSAFGGFYASKKYKRKRPYIRFVSWPYVHSMPYVNSILSKG